MDEVRLKKIRLKVADPAVWESFLSDVLDLPVAPTATGLEVETQGICFELQAGVATAVVWEFSLAPNVREIILSRWSFYQYRAGTSVSLNLAADRLCFQIDAHSEVVVCFDAL
ncbi:MAG: hypothetical protein LW878_00680, partial [Proteobacteria bacterium]|nr:hypothetical protein [Pseudomonadota bacterium]